MKYIRTIIIFSLLVFLPAGCGGGGGGDFNITSSIDEPVMTYHKCPDTDVNDDGIVNIFDLNYMKNPYGSEKGDENYDSSADFNSDGVINLDDMVYLSCCYGVQASELPELGLYIWDGGCRSAN